MARKNIRRTHWQQLEAKVKQGVKKEDCMAFLTGDVVDLKEDVAEKIYASVSQNTTTKPKAEVTKKEARA